MQEARDLAEATGMPGVVAGIGVILSEVDLMVSGPATGVRRARETAALADRIGSSALRDTAMLLSAWALAFDADQPAAAAALAEVGPAVGPDDREGLSLAAEAVAPLLAHDLTAAAALLDAATTALGRNPAGAPVSVWGLWYLLRVVLDQDPAEAAARFAAAPGGRRASNVAAGQLAEAVRLGRAGRGDEAVAVQAEAERVLAVVPWWARLLRLLVHEAALADGWGDPLPTLRADLAVFEADDAKDLARTARELLRRGGVTVRRGRGDSVVPGWAAAHGVTSREYDVLEMVAAGSTNAEVAARLHLSARTVEHHVARVLAKARRPDRRALARWYAEGQAGRAPGGEQR
jgi:DNA-binding CsgD family transcriptional regulator